MNLIKVFVLSLNELNEAIEDDFSRVCINNYYMDKIKKTGSRKIAVEELAAGMLLKSFTDICTEDTILENEYGKPFVPGRKIFNISHCDDFAVIAVSDGIAQIGIDIENIGRVTPKIISRVTDIKTVNYDDVKLTTLWTEVESRLKALGTGFYLEPKIIDEYNFYTESIVYENSVISISSQIEFTYSVKDVNIKKLLSI